MTVQETTMLMEILNTAYPRFYSGHSASDKKQAAKLWAEMFRNDDFRMVAAAVKAFIATDEKGFPPHIGAIKAKLRQISSPQEMTEQEAWSLVYRAICNSAYHSETEFSALPDTLRRMVGSPSQLREWAGMDSDTVQSVVASNFQRSYRAKAKSNREWEALPADIQALAREVAGQLAPPEKTDAPGGALPPRSTRSRADIQRDLETLREKFGTGQGKRRKEMPEISEEEIARRREENMRRLREGAETQ